MDNRCKTLAYPTEILGLIGHTERACWLAHCARLLVSALRLAGYTADQHTVNSGPVWKPDVHGRIVESIPKYVQNHT